MNIVQFDDCTNPPEHRQHAYERRTIHLEFEECGGIQCAEPRSGPRRQPVLRRSTLRATCLRLLTKPLWPKHRPRAIIRPFNRQKHVARRRVRRNARRERSPKASSMHGRGPDGTHFCLSGYARSRERRTSLIRATCFPDQGRVSPSDAMLNRRSAFSRQGATAKVRSPNNQSAKPSSPNVARRPKMRYLPLRRGRNSSPPARKFSFGLPSPAFL